MREPCVGVKEITNSLTQRNKQPGNHNSWANSLTRGMGEKVMTYTVWTTLALMGLGVAVFGTGLLIGIKIVNQDWIEWLEGNNIEWLEDTDGQSLIHAYDHEPSAAPLGRRVLKRDEAQRREG